MRYRLMASYLGASYQAAVGPTDRDVTLFAAPPPPEAHGFSPVPGGIWRKQVRVDELDALWESRPIGSYHGEPCLVLDDLGDRLHIVYLGMDERRAGQLGYWQVDKGVFEVVVARHEVTDLAEERHEFPIALLLSTLPRALSAGGTGAGGAGAGSAAGPGVSRGGPDRMALGSGGPGNGAPGMGGQVPGGGIAAWNGQPMTGSYPMPAAGPQQPPANASQQLSLGAAQQAASPQQAPNGMRQLPAAGLQQPAGAAGQQPVTGSYQMPAGPQQALPQAPGGLTGMPTAVPAMQQGRQPLGGPAQLPAGGQPPAGSPLQGQPQVQAQAPMPQQTFAAQSAQPGPSLQAQAQQAQAQQYPVAAQLPPAQPQQNVTTQQNVAPQQAVSAQQQLPNAQPPAAVAAWHGSPAPDGNGTWYYQPPDLDPQHGGLAQNGVNGYAQPGQGAGYQQAQSPQQAQSLPQAPQQQAAPAQPAQAQLPQFTPQAQAPPATQPLQVAQATAQPVAQQASQVPFPPAALSGSVTLPSVDSGIAAPLPAPTLTPASSSDFTATGPLPSAPQQEQADQAANADPTAGGALSKLTGAVRGRRAARKPRLAMATIFADLVDLAHIPRSAYAVDDEVTGAMCLFKTEGGYEVFSCAEDARHEVRFFEDEEAAYFYLFGVLAAEALRNGRLSPRRGALESRNVIEQKPNENKKNGRKSSR